MKNQNKSKKPRSKKYKARPVNTLAAFNTIFGKHEQMIQTAVDAVAAEQLKQQLITPMRADQITDIGIAFRLSMAAMTTGHGHESHWNTITCALNIALVLCERGIGKEYEPQIIEALNGAFRAKLRGDRSGNWGFDGPAIQAINHALEVHDAQIELATQAEVKDALTEVSRRIDSGDVYREVHENL